MTAPRMTDEASTPTRMDDERYDAHANGRVMISDFAAVYNEGLRARSSEAALLARVERLEEVARRLVRVPIRDCPWGCEPDDGHRPTCPVTAAAAALSEKP